MGKLESHVVVHTYTHTTLTNSAIVFCAQNKRINQDRL